MTPEGLLARWGESLSTRDHAKRADLLRSCCSSDVEFVPPDERPAVKGIDNLIEHLADYTAKWPAETTVTLAGAVEAHHDWCRGVLLFDFPNRQVTGTEIARIRDGLMDTIVVFAGPPI